MRTFKVLPSIAAAALLAAGAFACSGGDTPATPSATSNSPTGSGGGGTSTAAKLSIFLTDSPFSDAKALLVTFDNVSVHQADPGEWKDLTFSGGAGVKERTCDLKHLTDGKTDVLGVADLTAGKYTQIRLNVTKADIYFDKTSNATDAAPCGASITVVGSTDNAPVEIPSGEVKLNHEFTLQAATATTIKLDFDGDQSVRQTGSGNGSGRGNSGSNSKYMMTPVIRVLSVQ